MNLINKFLNKEINKYSFNFLVIIGMWLIIPLIIVFCDLFELLIYNIIHGVNYSIYGLFREIIILPPIFSLSALWAFITGLATLILKLFSIIFKKNLSAFKLFLATNSFSVILSITSFFIFANYEVSFDGTAGDGIAIYLLLFSMVGNAIFIPLIIVTYFVLRLIEHIKQDFRINDCKFIQNKYYKIFATLGVLITIIYLVLAPIVFLSWILTQNSK